ncbi:MAG: lptF [Paucimonas sp.]|jgi:lipopolysaccharide export system permease protein|nr:lptF [Paucimonas sp.]
MIFQRALRRELNSTAGAVLTTLLTIVITLMVIKILGQAASGRVATQDVIELVGFEAIKLLPVILIVTGFVSSLLVVTRSYQDSEMVVWFASGVSLLQWLKPVLSFAAPLIAMVAALSFVVAPWAQRESIEFRERFQKREDVSRVTPGKFQESASSNRVFFVEAMSGDATRVRNVFVNSVNPEGRTTVVVAKEGLVELKPNGDKFLVMEKGRRYDGIPNRLDFEMMEFERYSVLVSRQSMEAGTGRSASALRTSELLADPTQRNLSELLWRISLPLMALFLVVLAVPLAFANPRGGRSANLIIALLLVVAYNNMTAVFESLVAQGRLSFWVGLWPIHLLALLTAVFLFLWRLKVNSPYHPAVLLASLRTTRAARRKAGKA